MAAHDRDFRITVVCLGNICRSPIGEAVLRSRLAAAGMTEIEVDSAGTGDWHIGHDADPRARATLAANGYEIDHIARQITPEWFDGIDLVLAMDSSNYRDLQELIRRSGSEVELRMIRSFDPELAHLPEPHPDLDVPDPYFGGPEGFDEVLGMLETSSNGLIAVLRQGTAYDRSPTEEMP